LLLKLNDNLEIVLMLNENQILLNRSRNFNHILVIGAIP
jgi:hypothetical protein